jgi:hypothetical protein
LQLIGIYLFIFIYGIHPNAASRGPGSEQSVENEEMLIVDIERKPIQLWFQFVQTQRERISQIELGIDLKDQGTSNFL